MADEITLSQTQIEQILALTKGRLVKYIDEQMEKMDIPDASKLASKKNLTDALTELKNQITAEITKTNEAVTKIATETETKISALTVKKASIMDNFKTVIDYAEEEEN